MSRDAAIRGPTVSPPGVQADAVTGKHRGATRTPGHLHHFPGSGLGPPGASGKDGASNHGAGAAALLRLLTLLLPLAALTPTLLPAQDLSDTGSAQELSDREAAQLLRAARSEQNRFESIRRNYLPWTWQSGGGPCDERIGRFCLTYSRSGAPEWEPPEEAEEVVRARARLIESLERTASSLPGDGWTAGQWVRYLVEAGRTDDAVDAAARCQAAPWWCSALAGFAQHLAGRPGAADSSFSAALVQMPPDERREWHDLAVLLDDRTLRQFRRTPPEEREAFADRFWRVASPLYLRPGNDLRSEHFSRHVWDRLQDRARSTEGISWGWDLRQIVLRYGWPIGWERIRQRPGTMDQPSLVSRYARTDRSLLPPADIFVEDDLTAGEWDLDAPRPRVAYGVPLPGGRARWFETLDHQIAAFPRGDSAIVIAAYRLPADSLAADASIVAAFGWMTDAAAPPLVLPFGEVGVDGTLIAPLPAGSGVASLEVLAEEEKRAARSRTGLRIDRPRTGTLGVSDILLLARPDALPDSLEEARTNVRTSTHVRAGESVGIFWEMHGLPEHPENLAISVRMLEREGGWLRRLGRRIGVVRENIPIRLRWQETAEPREFVGRSVSIQIPNLEPGDYTLELAVSGPDQHEVTTRRTVRVVE